MDDNQDTLDKEEYWNTTTKLPADVFKAWQKPNQAITPVGVLATVDQDGKPRTPPFGSLRSLTPRLLRLCSMHFHDTCANLIRNGRVSVSLMSPPNIAVNVRGRAKMVKEELDADKNFAIIEIDIESVKNDMAYRIVIDSGIEISAKVKFKAWYDDVMGEMEAVG